MADGKTDTQIISGYDLSFDGLSCDHLDVSEFTPPERAGTAVALQSSANGITTVESMQGGYTPVKEIKMKVPVCSDSNSAFMKLLNWLELCRPKGRGGGGDFQKLSGVFQTYNWKGDPVEKYEFFDCWPFKCEIDETNSEEEKDLMMATFSCYVEKVIRTDEQ